jgi:Ca2+:H+ antiporter
VRGSTNVVKASIAGSIVGDILLVLGASMLAGGLRHTEQHFKSGWRPLPGDVGGGVNPAGGRPGAPGAKTTDRLGALSVSISIVLLLVIFALSRLHADHPLSAVRRGLRARGRGSARAALVLAAATAGIAWMSEILGRRDRANLA